jgi:hypothetical protein
MIVQTRALSDRRVAGQLLEELRDRVHHEPVPSRSVYDTANDARVWGPAGSEKKRRMHAHRPDYIPACSHRDRAAAA